MSAGEVKRSFLQRVFRHAPDDVLPLAIEHQRIYILPTARGAAFLAALLLMLVASINYSLSLGYALSFLLTGLFSASLLHTYRNLAHLEITSIDPEPGFAGGHAAFTVKLTARDGRARHGIELATRDRRSGVRADIEHEARTTLEVAAPSRGRLALGRMTVSSDWPLGLWRAWSYAHAPVDTPVYPAPEADAPAVPESASADGSGHARPAETGDVAGLRDYVHGDPPSRIAWKRAARGDALHVRLMDSRQGPARIALTLEGTALHDPEARLSRLCAWVLRAASSDAEYSLELGGTTLDHAGGPAHRRAALDALALHGMPTMTSSRPSASR